MFSILLISQNEAFYDAISTLLHPKPEVYLFKHWGALNDFLNVQPTKDAQFGVILLDTLTQPEWATFFREIKKHSGTANYEIFAIIDDLAARGDVFAAGVDDFLLYPFHPAEFSKRIGCGWEHKNLHEQVQETQLYAAKTAQVMLLTRLLDEQSDLAAIHSQALNQMISFFDADGGEIWLLSQDKRYLDLVSSQSKPNIQHEHARQASDQGCLGKALRENRLIHFKVAESDHHDSFCNLHENCNEIIAFPLAYRNVAIGVIKVCKCVAGTFLPQEISLLEAVASHIAVAISHAKLEIELRRTIEQQRVLYEMSVQISGGLDLNATLNLALNWVMRLINAEISLLWLVDDSRSGADKIELAAISNMLQIPEISLALDECPEGQVIGQKQAVLIHHLDDDPYASSELSQILEYRLINLFSLPLIYRENSIGAITILNKLDRSFALAEKQLLTVAVEIIAIAIYNAKLYERTITLLDETKLLQRRATQDERLKTIGRLTASFSHAINNPMQAIRGALMLAEEDIDQPDELLTYIHLCQKESKRIIQIIDRLRKIYRQQMDRVTSFDINYLLQETLAVTEEEAKRQNLTILAELFPALPIIRGNYNQLHLAFLGIMLNFIDHIGEAGGGMMKVATRDDTNWVRVTIQTAEAINLQYKNSSYDNGTGEQEFQDLMEILFGLSPTREIILANSGKMSFSANDQITELVVSLPKNA